MAGQSRKPHVSTISNMCYNSTNWAKSVIPERFCTKGMNQREAWQQKKRNKVFLQIEGKSESLEEYKRIDTTRKANT